MIYDTIDHAALYAPICDALKTILDFAAGVTASTETGKHELGDGLFAMVGRYATEPAEERLFESHRKYIDVQIVVEGRERLDVAPLAVAVENDPYDAESDCAFYHAPAEFTTQVALQEGAFIVLYPHDAHKPNCTLEEIENITKVVGKIPVE
ncbi:MAG: YhcH/YjgK/YiaL family protein [Phycisphaerales bacterium]|jgi:biofilm protein TabA|nr:YhcH/YjgK/YiaL family protein [Phycisphaerales bacterium]MBT7170690.1 YhcH/YjgK/YiaL family protein [Phycisphaerales bacterium]